MNLRPALLLITLCCLFSSFAQEKQKKPFELFEEAEQAYNNGEYSLALQLLDKCLTLKAGYMDAYPLRASVKEQLKDLDGALTDYSIFLEQFPDHTDVLMSRGVLRFNLGFYEQAKEDFNRLLTIQSNETNAVFYRRNMSVDDKNPIMTTNSSQHNPYVLNYLGLIEYKLNDPEKALVYLDSAIRIESNEPDFYVNRGLVKEMVKDSSSVVEFEKALKLNPNHVLAKHNLDAIKARHGQSASSEERLTRTIEADSTMLYPYLERAQQRYEAGYYEGALDDYNQAAEMAPDNYEILFARGLAKEKLKDYEGAFSDYTKAIGLKEDYPKAWLSRGNVLLKLERYDDAIEDYNVALVYYSDYPLAYYNRGMAKVKLKKNDEACSDFRRAEEMGMKIDAKIKSRICN